MQEILKLIHSDSDDERVKFLIEKKILAEEAPCCNNKSCLKKPKMYLDKSKKDRIDGRGWMCNDCTTSKSIRKNTFLDD